METCSSVNTLNLDTIMPGPEDYAIETLATSLMGGMAEATTETFYTGTHMSVEMINIRLYRVLEWITRPIRLRSIASCTKWEEEDLQVMHEAPSKEKL